jgi:hypothetical protein
MGFHETQIIPLIFYGHRMFRTAANQVNKKLTTKFSKQGIKNTFPFTLSQPNQLRTIENPSRSM